MVQSRGYGVHVQGRLGKVGRQGIFIVAEGGGRGGVWGRAATTSASTSRATGETVHEDDERWELDSMDRLK